MALTVALTVAVLAATVPAVERAGVHRSDAAVRSAVDRLVAEARALDADSDALPGDLAGARRIIWLDLPESGVARAGVERLRLAAGAPGAAAGTRITWRVQGGTRHARVVGLTIRPADPRETAVVVEDGGRRRLVLELVRVGGRRVIRVHRRGFKYEAATTPAHVRGPAGTDGRG